MGDCTECADHESGCCFKHKMEHWRSRGSAGGFSIPAHFKASQTQREIVREIHEEAARTGREIQRKY